MLGDNKISFVISKMNRDTKENKLKWSEPAIYRDLKLNSSEELVGKIYQTEFNNRTIRLFKINKQIQTDEFEFTWVPDYKLIILDSNWNIDWEFPRYREIEDLYKTVSYKVADMDSFFNSINVFEEF